MTSRLVVATALASAVIVTVLGMAGLAGPAVARDLTVVSRGGALQQAQHAIFFQPFTAATGVKLHEESWGGGLGVLQSKVESGADGWDVVLVNGPELQAGCAEGLYEKLDWAHIGGKDHYLPQGVSDCGVGAVLHSMVLAWDRGKFKGAPSWADFWDIAKYPGKRGLRRDVRGNLEIALIADGVAPADVYKTLATKDGVDRAFRKLDQLKPYIVWWKSAPEAAKILGSGEVLMSSADNVAVAAADASGHHDFGMQWAGSLDFVQSWVILKGSPNVANAYRFLAFAGDPKRQAELTQALPVGGLAKGAATGLPPAVLAEAPSNPANLKQALAIDDGFWQANLAKLSQRFDAWLAR